jgi:hypothetical protein
LLRMEQDNFTVERLSLKARYGFGDDDGFHFLLSNLRGL